MGWLFHEKVNYNVLSQLVNLNVPGLNLFPDVR